MDDYCGDSVVKFNCFIHSPAFYWEVVHFTMNDFQFTLNIEKLKISDPVTQIPLIGPSYAKKLKKLNINTVEDLLHHYPARYEDFSKKRKINQLVAGETVTVTGTVLEIKNIYTKNRKRFTKAVVADETGQIDVVWFNQPYLTQNIKKNSRLNLSGSLGTFSNRPTIVSPEYEAAKGNGGNVSLQPFNDGQKSAVHTGRLVPIYPETRGISSKWLRSRVNVTIQQLNRLTIDDIEFLPADIQARQGLTNSKTAINQIHFPEDWDQIKKARRRLAFDELFLLQLQALKRRQEWRSKPLANILEINNQQSAINNFIDSLPFKLTNAQSRSVDEILRDLEKEVPMNRLLEGEVGSGKTVVATAAMFAAHLNGLQSVLMAPTEVLAEQHYKEIKKMLEPFEVRVGLITGSRNDVAAGLVPASEKATTRVAATKNPHIIIGTHALLYDHVEFDQLGLVVIDEQHRFGVEQRAQLLKKTKDEKVPHLLTMTATPIPRSLSLTIYGDLDLSILDEMPPGRKPVKTWVVPNRKRQDAYNWIQKQVQQNRAQVFIIYPLIEESDHETMQSVKAATAEFEKLSREIFPELNLALLHGRVKSKEKNQILKDFKDGKYQILVATQVVEVGIDIPNATIMIVEGADRFGLASLHQLRGRVGRSDRESYCLLFSQSRSPKVFKRLRAMEQTNDGFKLAELDLKMRGPGEIYGTKQHGITELKIASLSDVKLIETTRKEAKRLIEKDPNLTNHPNLKAKLERMTGGLVEPN